jgi:hypothetical protein
MIDITANMMAAAEACFEVEPSPINETWWLKFCTKFVPNEKQKSAMYQTCTKQKRQQKGTKGHKTEIAEKC